MRPYRGKRIDNREWVYGGLVMYKDKTFISNMCKDHLGYICHSEGVHPDSVGQSTGLKDKNGVEIYGEGDIYKDADGIISNVKMAVDGWALVPIKKGTTLRNLYWQNVCDVTKGEVIGNTTDDKKLLEKT